MTVNISRFGHSMPLGEWAQVFGIPASTLRSRLKRGWPLYRALAPRDGVELWLQESWAYGFRRLSIVFDSDGTVRYPQGVPLANNYPDYRKGEVMTPEYARSVFTAYGYFKVGANLHVSEIIVAGDGHIVR